MKIFSVTALLLLFFITGSSMESKDGGVKKPDLDIQDQRTMNIAHRGASGDAPEETEPAFDKAAKTDGAWLEMDLQKTKDGELVAIHDEKVDRTTDGEGRVGDYTLDEIKELDAGSWFNEKHPEKSDESFEGAEILTLDEIFDRYGRSNNYYIETKSPGINKDMEDPLVKTIEDYGMDKEQNVIVQSFDQDSLKKIHKLNEEIPLIQLLKWEENEDGELEEKDDTVPAPDAMTDEDFSEIREYAAGIGPKLENEEEDEVIDGNFTRQTKQQGLLFHVYTINDEKNMERLIEWGATGIFTNYPERLEDMLGS